MVLNCCRTCTVCVSQWPPLCCSRTERDLDTGRLAPKRKSRSEPEQRKQEDRALNLALVRLEACTFEMRFLYPRQPSMDKSSDAAPVYYPDFQQGHESTAIYFRNPPQCNHSDGSSASVSCRFDVVGRSRLYTPDKYRTDSRSMNYHFSTPRSRACMRGTAREGVGYRLTQPVWSSCMALARPHPVLVT